MEFVILGLLMIRKLSQYDLRSALQQKVSPFLSASLGSIQAALKKLESNRHVEYDEVIENGRRKKMYTLTPAGKQYFLDWMLSPIVISRLEQEVTNRLFFLGFMSPAERLTIIRTVIIQLESNVLEFEAASEEANQKSVPEHLQQVVKFQLKTLDLGLYYHRGMLVWFTELANELEVIANEV